MNVTQEQLATTANEIRALCADMVDKANSGHPGAPLGMADVATLLWLKYFNFDVKDPGWMGRDRLVFSGGHASSLAYALFHLAGVGDSRWTSSRASASSGAAARAIPSAG